MRDYLVRPASVMRREARASLLLKREIYKAEGSGYVGVEALLVAEAAVLRAGQRRFECVVLTVDEGTGEIVRARPLHGGGVQTVMRSDLPHAARMRANTERVRAEDALREVLAQG